MGTVSSALSTSNSLNTPVTGSTATTGAGSSGSSTNYFSGLSSYSQDFDQVISRAVSIASLPVELLSNQQTALQGQASELSTLDGKFSAVQSALQDIGDALGGSGMNTIVSNPAVASVTVAAGAGQGAYSISVSSIGSYATSLSGASWNDADGESTAYNLVFGSHTYSFTTADNSAATVASTINAQYGNLVQATAVNVGSASSPDYRISLQSASLGPMELDIQAQAGANLQTSQSAASGNATSLTAYSWDPSGDPSTFTLAVDDTDYTLTPADNSAASVAAAINAIAGSPVAATVVNLGTDASPDLRIQLQSASADVASVDLQDAAGDSLQQQETPVAADSAVSLTASNWAPQPDALGNPIEYTLTVGDVTQTFTAGDDTAAGVAAAINSLSGNPVTANVVDVGTAGAPDYRLQLVDNTGSGESPQLSSSTAFSLQSQGAAGSLAAYEVANSGVTVTSNTRNVSIATGTTLTLLGKGSTDVTVTQSASTLSDALSGFADAYNATVAELAKQYGQSGGALQGQSIVYRLSQTLAAMSTYSSSSSGSLGLADLGFTLNDDGTLTYSPLTMMASDLTNPSGVIALLGSATGGGFLEQATNAINSVEAAGTGLLKTGETDTQQQLTRLAGTISDKQDAIQRLQTTLTNQMAQADAAIEAMQQQYTYLSTMLAAQRTADQMYANE